MTALRPELVALAWRQPRIGAQQPRYEVMRDGDRIGVSTHAAFTDTRVAPSRTYVYRIRDTSAAGHPGPLSRPLRVTTPALPTPAPIRATTPPPTPTKPRTPTPPSRPADPPQTSPPDRPRALSAAMVARLFWRAGFGASPAELTQWTGRPTDELVDFFLTSPNSLRSTATPPTTAGLPIDPLASDEELVMEWLDAMQRSTNPLVERLTFFWHRHWAVSAEVGIPAASLLAYRNRLRRYADLPANPNASFADMALELTTQDAAISQYLTGYLNVADSPNENYAREFMELFCLGLLDDAGRASYAQNDVRELARAFTGYTLDFATGKIRLDPNLVDAGTKTLFGRSANFDAPAAVRVVLAHPNHATHLVRKLWGEFIVDPIPTDTLAQLTSAYAGGGLALAPLLRAILSHPLIFSSLAEPNMIKPPVVYTVGVLKALGAPLRDTVQFDALMKMQQEPYRPPNVAGWEGGASFLNTNTTQARFNLVTTCLVLLGQADDLPNETAQQAVDRAYAACGSPWLAAANHVAIQTFAAAAPDSTPAQRLARQYALRALLLGGPDNQVM